jgi:hypothetical protein
MDFIAVFTSSGVFSVGVLLVMGQCTSKRRLAKEDEPRQAFLLH